VGGREMGRAEVAAMLEGVAHHRADVFGRILVSVVGPPAPPLFFWAEEGPMADDPLFPLPPLQELVTIPWWIEVIPAVVLLL